MARSKANKGSKLKIIPLGGVDEIGKNMTVYEYEDGSKLFIGVSK